MEPKEENPENPQRSKQDQVETIDPQDKTTHLSLHNHSTQLSQDYSQNTTLILFNPNLGTSRLNRIRGKATTWGRGLGRRDRAERGAVQGSGSAQPGLQLESCPLGRIPGPERELERDQGARDAGEDGSGPEEAANENRARRRAGKGGKGQRAAQEGEKGKLGLGGRPRRSGAGTAGGRKAGSGVSAELRQVQAAAE